MNSVYKITPTADKKSALRIHPNTAFGLGISKRKIGVLGFGCLRQFATVTLSDEVKENEIGLSSRLIADLHPPLFPEYEITGDSGGWKLGPFIGMLMSREDRNLTPAFLNKMKIYVGEYQRIHGAVVVFALDKVDTVGRLIEGYCYNPGAQTFERGIYPLPSSMYRAIGLSDFWKNYFLSVMGNRFFNNQYFNKWEMYQWYSQDPVISESIPFTCVYRSPQDVFFSLEEYGKAFIKPLSGLGGRGVTQVRLSGGQYVFRFRENGVNHRESILSKEEAREFIEIKFSNGRYLVQQPIELMKRKGRVIDFRCVMQKNESGEWNCMAIIGRSGHRGSVVSNISSGGSAFPIQSLETDRIPGSDDPLSNPEEEIRAFALRVCDTLDEYGLNCGMLGLDVGIDTKGKLWLIEINNRDPDPTIALDVHDRPLYERLKTGIPLYLRFLAGFRQG